MDSVTPPHHTQQPPATQSEPHMHNRRVMTRIMRLSPVSCALEVEEQVQDAPLKGGPEPVFTLGVPLLVDDTERNVLVGGASLCTHTHIRQLYNICAHGVCVCVCVCVCAPVQHTCAHETSIQHACVLCVCVCAPVRACVRGQ